MSESVGMLILNSMITETSPVVETIYGSLMSSWPGQTFVALYAVCVGYMVLMGRAGDRSKEWGISIFMLLVIGGVSSSYSMFNEWFATPLWGMAQAAGSMAASGGDASTGVLSDLLNSGEESLGKLLTAMDQVHVSGNFISDAWLYIKVAVVVGIMLVLACAQYLAMVVLLCIALFSLLMMFAVGGPCLWLASFKETRFVFWAWLRATLNYAIWIFFLGAVSGVGNKYIGKVADIITLWDFERDGLFVKPIGAIMLLTAISIYMLLKASDWAAALTGGSSTNTGVIGAMGGVAGGALGGAINAGGGAAGSAAKWGAGVAANKTSMGAAAYRAYSAMKGLGKPK